MGMKRKLSFAEGDWGDREELERNPSKRPKNFDRTGTGGGSRCSSQGQEKNKKNKKNDEEQHQIFRNTIRDRKFYRTWRNRILRDKAFKRSRPMNLYFSPEPTQCPETEPRTDAGLPCVRLEEFEYLPVTVNGRRAYLFVDSGCTTCFLKHRHARRMGLRVDYYKRSALFTLSKASRTKFGTVKSLEMELEGGYGVIRNRGLVFPKGYEYDEEGVDHDPGEIGQDVLERYKVLQVYRKDGAYLYFKDPEMLKNTSSSSSKKKPSRRSRQKKNKESFKPSQGLYLTTHFKKTRDDPPISTLLDTGDYESQVSVKILEKLELDPIVCRHYPHQKVVKGKLHLSNQEYLIVPFVVEEEGLSDPLVLGRYVYSDHLAAIDYHEREFYLQTKFQRFKMRVTGQGLHEQFDY